FFHVDRGQGLHAIPEQMRKSSILCVLLPAKQRCGQCPASIKWNSLQARGEAPSDLRSVVVTRPVQKRRPTGAVLEELANYLWLTRLRHCLGPMRSVQFAKKQHPHVTCGVECTRRNACPKELQFAFRFAILWDAWPRLAGAICHPVEDKN